jgi:hypothetical protein
MSQPDIQNLGNCIEDARLAGLDSDPGPADPLQFNSLLGRLQTAKPNIAPLYVAPALTPYVNALDGLGEDQFNQILIKDPKREGEAGLTLDIAQAFLQRGEGFDPRAQRAFQEVVADLYDGFLGAESRGGVAPPDHETLPPMVKFGNPDFGPYTWPVDATESFGLKVGVVNLPPANTRRGIVAWAALGHETAGHDILHADDGLLNETATAVRNALNGNSTTKSLASYWASRIDETASDVLGILNMGPAPAIGLVAYFRGLNAAFTGSATLRTQGPAGDPHPADIVRGFLAAATVRQLQFAGASAWADAIDAETKKDLDTISLAGKTVSAEVARLSAQLVSQAIVTHPMESLENHAFGEIQNWRDEDEQIVQQLQGSLTVAGPLPADLGHGVFAAHLVAAATMSALTQGANIPQLFQRMLDLLKAMNDTNPVFGPLRVRHAGNLVRDRAYVPVFGRAAAATA